MGGLWVFEWVVCGCLNGWFVGFEWVVCGV